MAEQRGLVDIARLYKERGSTSDPWVGGCLKSVHWFSVALV